MNVPGTFSTLKFLIAREKIDLKFIASRNWYGQKFSPET